MVLTRDAPLILAAKTLEEKTEWSDALLGAVLRLAEARYLLEPSNSAGSQTGIF